MESVELVNVSLDEGSSVELVVESSVEL